MPLVWTEVEKQGFEALKETLMGRLALQIINPACPFVLRTDASGFSIGAVLEQAPCVEGMPTIPDTEGGKTVPVAFMSNS